MSPKVNVEVSHVKVGHVKDSHVKVNHVSAKVNVGKVHKFEWCALEFESGI